MPGILQYLPRLCESFAGVAPKGSWWSTCGGYQVSGLRSHAAELYRQGAREFESLSSRGCNYLEKVRSARMAVEVSRRRLLLLLRLPECCWVV